MDAHELAELFPMMPDAEIDILALDIGKNGLFDAITTLDGKILDGRNRAEACRRSGTEPCYREYAGDDPLGFVIGHNLHRRHLNESQRAMVGAKLANLNHGQNESRAADLPVSPVTQSQAADLLNVSERLVRQAKKVERDAPDLAQKVRSGEMKLGHAEREIKREEHRKAVEAVQEQEAVEPTGLYDVIVIDPPWPMKKIERDCRPNQTEHLDYPTMTIAEIGDMDIPAADDAHIWLWTTHKFLPDALDILCRWQAKYVCTFVWNKAGGPQPFGLPQYNCEFALYARIGTPQFVDTKAFKTCFDGKRGKHSEKPEEFYDVIRRVAAGRRLDMFNRREIAGFDSWGNEA